jgi:hypothetical protein
MQAEYVGRLTGNTFIQMNYLVGMWMILGKLVLQPLHLA